MGNTSYADRVQVDGPFHVSAEQLVDLDKVVSLLEKDFQKARSDLVGKKAISILPEISSTGDNGEHDIKAKQTAEKYFGPVSVEYELRLNGEIIHTAATLNEAINSPALDAHSVVAIVCSLGFDQTRVFLELDKYGACVRAWPGRAPRTVGESQAALLTWCRNNGPNSYKNAISKLSGMCWYLFAAFMLFTSVFLPSTEDQIKEQVKSDASALIEQGIDQDNVTEAVELLLRNEFMIVENVVDSVGPPDWYPWATLIGIILCAVLSIKTSFCVEIGKGRTAYGFWTNWNRFVYVFVPGVLFSTVVGPALWSIVASLVNTR